MSSNNDSRSADLPSDRRYDAAHSVQAPNRTWRDSTVPCPSLSASPPKTRRSAPPADSNTPSINCGPTPPSSPTGCRATATKWIAAPTSSPPARPISTPSSATHNPGSKSNGKSSTTALATLSSRRRTHRTRIGDRRPGDRTDARPRPGPRRAGSPLGEKADLARREAELAEWVAALDRDRQDWTERRDRLDEREAAVEARQRDLDHRQGELYQSIEDFSAEKAGFGQRTSEIDRREQQVAQWEARLESQVAALDAQTQSLRDRAGELEMERAELRHRTNEVAGREKELASAEKQLAYRQQEIATALERFERLGVTEKRMRELESEAAEFAARRRYLDEAESQLAQDRTDFTEQVRELDRQRRLFQEPPAASSGRSPRKSSSFTKNSSSATRSSTSAKPSSTTARRRSSRCAASSAARNAKALEMRLATEETWNQLAGAMAPATLIRSISIVRAKLADHYRQSLEIAAKSAELETVRRDLASQLDTLETQRHELQQWAQRRHEDIEHQASRLVVREQELDRQQQHYEQMESRWHLEQIEYQAEIRRLLAALRSVELKAA